LESILDQNPNFKNNKWIAGSSLILLGLVLIIDVLVYYYVSTDVSISPLLPRFTTVYLNQNIINFAILQSISLFPSGIFHLLKFYKISIISTLLIVLIAWVLRKEVDFYFWFY
jgi:hypothetical protein